jgi:hypothetical protein
LDLKFLDETDAVLFNSCNSLEAYDAKRFIFCSLDWKFLDETDAVLFHCAANSLEAKPTAVKQRMEAMGVTGLTIWNIKSHLQVLPALLQLFIRYFESFRSTVQDLNTLGLLLRARDTGRSAT